MLLDWVVDNWDGIVAILTLITGGAFGLKKVKNKIDKKQNVEIQKIKIRLISMENSIAKLRSEIRMNGKLDENFKEQVGEQMKEVKNMIDKLLNLFLK